MNEEVWYVQLHFDVAENTVSHQFFLQDCDSLLGFLTYQNEIHPIKQDTQRLNSCLSSVQQDS